MAIVKKKISDFDPASTLTNLWTLGYSIVGGIRKTVRVSLEFVGIAADNANAAAQRAETISDNLTDTLASKADLDPATSAIVPSQLFPSLSLSGSPLHDLFIAAGAKWDGATKSWTVGTYTGVDTAMMTKIYSLSHNVLNNSNWESALINANIPVNLPSRKSPTSFTVNVSVKATCAFTNGGFEIIHLCPASSSVRMETYTYAFYGNSKLHTIVGQLLFQGNIGIQYFRQCNNLTNVQITQVKSNVDLSDCALLSLASLQFLVSNASNSSAITVTVHATVYAKLTDPSQAVWHAVNTAAQAKQISFATA